MIDKGDRVLVSISGGPDSVLLIHTLDALKDRLGIQLFAFTLDHCTRGGESAKDVRFVERLCNEMQIELESRKIDVGRLCKEKGLNFQDGARITRIDLLNKIAKQKKIDKIATGHNLSDSIETFFINLFRGTGLKGLRGILPKKNKFIRPLIKLKKDEIEEALDEGGILYRTDKSNLEDLYLRNRIRNKLLPLLKKEYSGSIEKTISSMLDIIREDQDYLEETVKDISKDIAKDKDSLNRGFLVIDLERLSALHKAIKRRLILHMIGSLRKNTSDISKENIDAAVGLLDETIERKEISIFSDLILIKEGESLYLLDMRGKDSFPDDIKNLFLDECNTKEYVIDYRSLNKGKSLVIDMGKERLTIRIVEAGKIKAILKGSDLENAYVDLEKIVFPIKIKKYTEGDSFIPYGMQGKKKLSDYFKDIKLPFSKRKTVKLLKDAEKMIWVIGFRIDERVKVDDNTKKVIAFKIKR